MEENNAINKTAHLYARFSTKIQAKGHSRQRQIDSFTEYCNRHGYSVGNLYIDEGKSGFTDDLKHRTELNRLLSDVNDGRISNTSTVIIEGFDRLSRAKLQSALRLFLDMLDTGLTLITLNDGAIFTSDSDVTSILVSVIHLSRAHSESEMKSIRLSKVWAKKLEDAKSGKVITKRVPAWINVVGKGDNAKFKLNPMAEAVKEMFMLTIAGHGVMSTCKQLNSMLDDGHNGLKPDKGDYWKRSSVRRILKDTSTYGNWMFKGHELVEYFPPVISFQTYKRAQLAIASRVKSPGTLTRTGSAANGSTKKEELMQERRNLFGSWYCHHCGSGLRYVGGTDKSKERIRCTGADIGICTQWHDIKYSKFEYRILEALLEIDWAVAADDGTFDERSTVEQELVAVNLSIDNLVTAISMANEIEPLVKRLSELQGNATDLKLKLTEIDMRVTSGFSVTDICQLDDVSDGSFDLRTDIAQRIANVVSKIRVVPYKSGAPDSVSFGHGRGGTDNVILELRNGMIRRVMLSAVGVTVGNYLD